MPPLSVHIVRRLVRVSVPLSLSHCLPSVMKSRKLSVTKAIGYLRDSRSTCTLTMSSVSFSTWPFRIGRPQIHPNYGFLKQLHTFAACNYHPTPCDSAYRTWKRRQAQDINRFLNIMSDTTTVIPDQLMMCRSVMILLVWSRSHNRIR